jgi:hypothetical protein
LELAGLREKLSTALFALADGRDTRKANYKMITSQMNRELFQSVVGTFAPILGVITSMQEQIEYGLRISGLVVGLVAGLLSLWQILKKL